MVWMDCAGRQHFGHAGNGHIPYYSDCMLAAADFGWISSNSDEGHKLRGCCFLPSLVQVGPINRARGSWGPSFCAKFHPHTNNIGRDRRKVKRAVPIT